MNKQNKVRPQMQRLTDRLTERGDDGVAEREREREIHLGHLIPTYGQRDRQRHRIRKRNQDRQTERETTMSLHLYTFEYRDGINSQRTVKHVQNVKIW